MTELKNLTHRYGEHTVLENLSYCFPERGIVALMAPSGLGKTTLLRLLAGLEPPSEGNIHTDHKRIAVSFQEPRLIPWLSCEENVRFVLNADEKNSDRIQELLHALELSDVANALPDTLSGGMKQRVSLARALAYQGDLLLLDEPFSALDVSLKARILPLVKSANPDGLTIVITHSKEEAIALGAKILLLEGNPVRELKESE